MWLIFTPTLLLQTTEVKFNISLHVLANLHDKLPWQIYLKYYLKHEHECFIRYKLRVFWIASKTIHFIPMLSLCLRKNFEYRCCISRENQGKNFVKIYVCFITYKDSFTAMIFFVSCSWIINEFLKSWLKHSILYVLASHFLWLRRILSAIKEYYCLK